MAYPFAQYSSEKLFDNNPVGIPFPRLNRVLMEMQGEFFSGRKTRFDKGIVAFSCDANCGRFSS